MAVILPLFVLVGAGYVLGKSRRLDPAPLTDICLYLFMPALLFSALVDSPLTAAAAARYIGWFGLQIVVHWVAVSMWARWRGWEGTERSAVILALSSFNVGSYGVPVVLFALDEAALSGAMLLFVCSNVSSGTFGVYIAAGGRLKPQQALVSVFRLPLVYAAVLALGVNAAGLQLPDRLLEAAAWVGRAGPVVAMAVLGVQFARLPLAEIPYRRLAGGIAAKLLWGPVVGVAGVWVVGAEGQVAATLLICSFLPAAINTLLLAVRFEARPELVGAVLLGSTLCSPLGIGAVLMWLGQR